MCGKFFSIHKTWHSHLGQSHALSIQLGLLTRTYIYMYMYMCVRILYCYCIYTCIHIQVHIILHLYIYTSIYLSIYVTCMCVYVYIYIIEIHMGTALWGLYSSTSNNFSPPSWSKLPSQLLHLRVCGAETPNSADARPRVLVHLPGLPNKWSWSGAPRGTMWYEMVKQRVLN
jgi:hypothetical protein